MKLLSRAISVLVALSTICDARDSSSDKPLSSHQILPANFRPPQVFKNANLVRNINLEKAYIKETVNVVIENIDSKPQTEYYIPFDANTIGKVGGIVVHDKQDPKRPAFRAEVVEYDASRYVASWTE